MSREWKPGDVALVECSDGEWRQATCEPHANWAGALVWRFPDRVYRHVSDSAARPLVVIDPENREQSRRLFDMTFQRGGGPLALADALHEFANPKPPKPDEPMGLGAVVEDADGNRWIRVVPRIGYFYWQSADDAHNAAKWFAIDAVRVLSPGWEADQ